MPFPCSSPRTSCGVRGANGPAASSSVRAMVWNQLDRGPGHLFHAENPRAPRRGFPSRHLDLLCGAFVALNSDVIYPQTRPNPRRGIGAPFSTPVGLLLLMVDHTSRRFRRSQPPSKSRPRRLSLRFSFQSRPECRVWGPSRANIPEGPLEAQSQRDKGWPSACGLPAAMDASHSFIGVAVPSAPWWVVR